jgi:hypothetical protein
MSYQIDATWHKPIYLKDGKAQALIYYSSEIDTISKWEQRAYPFIKWKPVRFAPVPGAIAGLTTTLVKTQSPYSSLYRPMYTYAIKYQLTLFKVLTPPYMVEVQFLDANGFNLEKVKPGGRARTTTGMPLSIPCIRENLSAINELCRAISSD